jgi:hypothetical protein
MVLAAAGIPTIVCGKNSLHMVQHLIDVITDDCYQQKNRQIAYSLKTAIIKGEIITLGVITVIQFLR